MKARPVPIPTIARPRKPSAGVGAGSATAFPTTSTKSPRAVLRRAPQRSAARDLHRHVQQELDGDEQPDRREPDAVRMALARRDRAERGEVPAGGPADREPARGRADADPLVRHAGEPTPRSCRRREYAKLPASTREP